VERNFLTLGFFFLGQESKNSPSFIQQSNLPFSRAFPPLFLLVL
jgi:hypothetical protein